MLDLLNFDQVLEGTQIVFTGEGCADDQSMQGKVLSGVSRRAKKAGVPVVVVAGACKKEADQLYRQGVCGVFSTCRTAEDFSVQRQRAEENLASTMEAILQLYRAV